MCVAAANIAGQPATFLDLLSFRCLPARPARSMIIIMVTLVGLRFSADRPGNVPDRSDPARGAVDELSVHEHLVILQGHHPLPALVLAC